MTAFQIPAADADLTAAEVSQNVETCYRELTRLGELRENERVDAETYYSVRAALSETLADLLGLAV